eukprot:Skav200645  [mRNA]  locus=scaffold2539:96057:96556:- [translate_table: standard]
MSNVARRRIRRFLMSLRNLYFKSASADEERSRKEPEARQAVHAPWDVKSSDALRKIRIRQEFLQSQQNLTELTMLHLPLSFSKS